MRTTISTQKGDGTFDTRETIDPIKALTLAEIAKERARLNFKLEASGHAPANVTERIAELDAEIELRASAAE